MRRLEVRIFSTDALTLPSRSTMPTTGVFFVPTPALARFASHAGFAADIAFIHFHQPAKQFPIIEHRPANPHCHEPRRIAMDFQIAPQAGALKSPFFAFSISDTPRNHFCKSILVLWKIVPTVTEKLVLQVLQ